MKTMSRFFLQEPQELFPLPQLTATGDLFICQSPRPVSQAENLKLYFDQKA